MPRSCWSLLATTPIPHGAEVSLWLPCSLHDGAVIVVICQLCLMHVTHSSVDFALLVAACVRLTLCRFEPALGSSFKFASCPIKQTYPTEPHILLCCCHHDLIWQIKRRAEGVLRAKELEVVGKREELKKVEVAHAAAE